MANSHFYSHLQIKIQTFIIQQLIAEGRLPAAKVGQTNLVKESDLKLVQDRQTGRPPKGKGEN